MIRSHKVVRACLFLALLVFTFLNSSHCQRTDSQELRVLLIGFADRWADYGSRGDTPSFRDFLAIKKGRNDRTVESGEFIKLRLLYWPQDKSDPKHLAEGPSREMSFPAVREASCDETFASLSRSKQVSFLDPELKPSRFVFMSNAPSKRPRARSVLPCYQVK
jgi:hypothetical protein